KSRPPASNSSRTPVSCATRTIRATPPYSIRSSRTPSPCGNPRSRGSQCDQAPSPDMSSGETVLRVRDLTKTYRSAGDEVAVLRGVNLEVARGERVALTGESGSGKSTLRHLIAGLDAADSGESKCENIKLNE